MWPPQRWVYVAALITTVVGSIYKLATLGPDSLNQLSPDSQWASRNVWLGSSLLDRRSFQ